MAVPVAAIAKKAAEILASSKNGRKFIGYTVGIVIFLLLLPVIVIFGLFGWMSGNVSIDHDQILNGIPSEHYEQAAEAELALTKIDDIFTAKDMNIKQINMAKAIYVSCLVGKDTDDESFYDTLADCFTTTTKDTTVFDNISEKFCVEFTERDIKYFKELYGG